ncbi:MAG: aminoacyl-tRNA hydrolase [Verrucomicrobia bacterium]|nr:aminoacyl-tRNA hydrolase [Verrucomicrobiota bacterium]
MDNLWLIAGLGNPGREYARTRHNAGFLVVEEFARRSGLAWGSESRFQARVAKAATPQGTLVLCMPQTFMNASGESVGGLARFFRIHPSHVLVVVDDADLPLGTIRLRPGGSSGGHHGLDSVEQFLGTRDYPRLRVGIGRRTDGQRDIAGYVLSPFTVEERPLLEKVLDRCVRQMDCWQVQGLARAMNLYNGSEDSE